MNKKCSITLATGFTEQSFKQLEMKVLDEKKKNKEVMMKWQFTRR